MDNINYELPSCIVFSSLNTSRNKVPIIYLEAIGMRAKQISFTCSYALKNLTYPGTPLLRLLANSRSQ